MTTQFNAQNFLQTLTCPVDFNLLTEGVCLIPCCHKVNEAVARRYYGRIIGGVCELRKVCVICQTPVTSWVPDHTIRQLASSVFGHEQELKSLSHPPVVKEKKHKDIHSGCLPVPASAFNTKKKESVLPYPGPSAVFEHTRGDWTSNGGYFDNRQLYFKSKVKNSLFTRFKLTAVRNGTLYMGVWFQSDNASIRNYLQMHKVTYNNQGFCDTHDLAEIRRLFRILDVHNTFPPQYIEQLRAIVARGVCDPIS